METIDGDTLVEELVEKSSQDGQRRKKFRKRKISVDEEDSDDDHMMQMFRNFMVWITTDCLSKIGHKIKEEVRLGFGEVKRHRTFPRRSTQSRRRSKTSNERTKNANVNMSDTSSTISRTKSRSGRRPNKGVVEIHGYLWNKDKEVIEEDTKPGQTD